MTPQQISQQNCRKSKNVTLGLINSLDPSDWDISLLQEPYIYPNSLLTIASPHWNIIYPTASPNHDPSSTLILINSSIIPSTVVQILIPLHLITAITIQMEEDAHAINIINIYNPPNLNMALSQLQQWLSHTGPLSHTIWTGNFNKHI